MAINAKNKNLTAAKKTKNDEFYNGAHILRAMSIGNIIWSERLIGLAKATSVNI